MGGSGSGWRGAKKDIVEDCLVLSIEDFIRPGAVATRKSWRGSFRWHDQGQSILSFDYEVNLYGERRGALWLHAGRVHCFTLIATTPHFGGRRWWFRCPVKGIRAAKLYLPPGARQFGSRQAYVLTYRSCQESHRLDRLRHRITSLRERLRAG
jgi:hypothetical protein